MNKLLPDKKTILIINNDLDDSINKNFLKSSYFNVIITDIKNLKKAFKEVFKIEKENDNILIIINIDNYTPRIKNNIKDFFLQLFNTNNPNILFIIFRHISNEEQENILAQGNFFYHLKEKKIDENLYSFVILAFLHIQDMNRLNNFIIHTFQTIVDSHLVEQQKEKIEKLYEELERLSKIDTLTNVLNRKAFFEAMEMEKARTIRDIWRLEKIGGKDNKIEIPDNIKKIIKTKFKNKPSGDLLDYYGRFSCLMIDIDFFKQINDKYGHLVGDEVLRKLGDILNSKKIFREDDIVGRYGGEEFIVILPSTNTEFAKEPANRLKEQIKNMNFNANGTKFNITVSIGISEFNVEDKTCEEIINRADKALYFAKLNGRDQAAVYEEII